MNKKFFSLIYGDAIHTAPKKKVIPADQFSLLADAKEVLEKVKADAERYKMEVVKECEQLKEKAEKEGFEAGLNRLAEQIARLETEIANVRKEVEKAIVPVALKAARKIVGRELELSDQAIVDIIATILKSVAQHKKVILHVNKKDFEKIDANKSKLKQVFENLEAFSVRPREDILPGGCIVETDAGIVNAQLENQWQALEKAFDALLKSGGIKKVGA